MECGRAVRRTARRRQRGSESLEFVVATPALLLAILLVVAFGLAQYAQHVAEAVAHEAATAASVDRATAQDGQARGADLLHRMAAGLIVAPRLTVARGTDSVRAEVTGGVQRLIPFLDLTVHAVDVQSVERFSPAAAAAPTPAPAP